MPRTLNVGRNVQKGLGIDVALPAHVMQFAMNFW